MIVQGDITGIYLKIRPVKLHHGSPAFDKCPHEISRIFTRRNDKTGHAQIYQTFNRLFHLGGVFVGTSEQYHVAVFRRDIFDLSCDLRKESIGNIREHSAYYVRLPCPQRPGRKIRHIIHGLGNVHDLGDSRIAYPVLFAFSVKHERCHRNGYSCSLRYILEKNFARIVLGDNHVARNLFLFNSTTNIRIRYGITKTFCKNVNANPPKK